MSLSERLAFLISVNGDQAIRSFQKIGDSAEKNLGKADQRIDKLAHRATIAGAGMLSFAGVAAGALFKFADAEEDAHQSELKLQNTLANMPKLAGQDAKQFIDLAQAIQNKTAADGDQIVSAEAMLGTFRLTARQIKGVTPLVVDYARKFGVDLTSAAVQVGKALDGQIGALKRNGVSIDAVAFKADHYSAVTKALKDQVGGFAEDEGKTFSGSLQRLHNQLQDLEEGVGKGVVNAFSSAIGPVSSFSARLGETSPQTQEFVGRLAAIGTASIGAIGALSLIGGQLIKMRDRFTVADEAGGRTLTTLGKFAAGAGAAAGVLAIAEAADELGDQLVRLRYGSTNVDQLSLALARLSKDDDVTGELKDKFGKDLADLDHLLDKAGKHEFTHYQDAIDFINRDDNTKAAKEKIDALDKSLAALAATDKKAAQSAFDAIVKKSGVKAADLKKQLDDYRNALARSETQEVLTTDKADDLSDGLDDVGSSAEDAAVKAITFAEALDKTLGADLALGSAQDDLSGASQQLADDLAGVGDSVSSSTEQIYTFQDAMRDQFDSLVDANEAALDYADSVDALNEVLHGTAIGSENAADAMDRLTHGRKQQSDPRAIARATDAVVRSAEREVDAMVASGQIADTAEARKAAFRDRLVDLQKQFPEVADALGQYIAKLDKIPNLTTNAETSTKKLSTAKKNLKQDIRNVIKAADDEATAMEGNGTEIDKATRHHSALLTILTDLQKQFPLLAGVIQDYVNDVNDAYEDFLLQQVGGPDALARSFAPGSFGAPTNTSAPTSSSPTAPGSSRLQLSSAPNVNVNVYGDGLHSDEVAALVVTRTKRALVGSRAT